eukprot:6189873-Pleurochrysis_carterae.AAC.2
MLEKSEGVSVDGRRLDGKRGSEQLMSGSSPAAEVRRDSDNEGTRHANAATGRCVTVARACARALSARAPRSKASRAHDIEQNAKVEHESSSARGERGGARACQMIACAYTRAGHCSARGNG